MTQFTYHKIEELIEAHDVDSIRSCLLEGGDPNIGISEGCIPLIIDVIDELYQSPDNPKLLEILDQFVENGAYINQVKDCSFVPVMEAIHAQSLGALKILIDKNVEVNFISEYDYPNFTPLLLSVELDNMEMASLLIQKTSSDLIQFVGGHQVATALGYAFKNVNIPLIKLLLDHNADPDFIEWDHAYLPSRALIPESINTEERNQVDQLLNEFKENTDKNL